MYPLKMVPYFRHGSATPWGGSQLSQLFGKRAPDERTGESLEVSALSGMESRVENGEWAGRALGEVVEAWGQELTGLSLEAGFPLLLKLLDAREMLSVQVHPGDEYAQEHEGKLGKTEAWVVLAANPGARLVYGVSCESGEALSQAVAGGGLEDCLRWIPVAPGDVLYIPHGMVHALGGGIVVYEIQQASDVTYRFWDWGRVDAQGQPRQLHTQQALAVTDAALKLDKQPGATLIVEGGSRTVYVADRNFELSRLNVSGRMPLPAGRMQMLTPLGDCALSWAGGTLELTCGDSVLVPAGLEGAALAGRLPVMCSTTPDREALRELLGYRAVQVAGLTE